jgi:hypothetical protein
MLILNGFEWERWMQKGWNSRSFLAAASDPYSWDRITPTWKRNSLGQPGKLNFAVDATGPNAVQKMDIGFKGKRVGELADYLVSEFFVSPIDYDALQVKLMFDWSMAPESPWITSLPKGSIATPRVLLAFSFTGMQSCQSSQPDLCSEPGRSNEMLAWACLDHLERDKRAMLVAQWEIVTAMQKIVQAGSAGTTIKMPELLARAFPVGDPGSYLDTVQIVNLMIKRVKKAVDGPVDSVAVVAHPDHLPRAFKTTKTSFVMAALERTLPAKLLQSAVIPAMLPYRMLGEEGNGFNFFQPKRYKLLDGHEYSWFTPHGLAAVDDTGYKGFGYFPDGDPQFWVRERRTFLIFELWARAKIYAMRGIIPPERWPDQNAQKCAALAVARLYA